MAMKCGAVIMMVAGLFLVAALVITIAVMATAKHEDKHEEDTCFTPGCLRAALSVFDSIDVETKPCDDFYKFACGGFEKSAEIPDEDDRVSRLSMLEDELEKQLKEIFEEPITRNEPKPFRLAKTLYNNCMNITAIERAKFDPIHRRLKDLGKWPVLTDGTWQKNKFDWTENVYKSRELGYSNYFMEVNVDVDLHNSTRFVIKVDPPSHILNQKWLTKGWADPKVQAYSEYMVDIAGLLGASPRTANDQLRESLKFEMDLTDIALSGVKLQNLTLLNNPMTISEMNKRFPKLNWTRYVNKLLSPFVIIDVNHTVIVSQPEFIRKFETLVSKTKPQILANYALWKTVQESVSYLTDSMKKVQLFYNTAMRGETEEELPRWKECIDLVSKKMSISTGALYVRRNFDEDGKNKSTEVMEDVKNEIVKSLAEADWMDEETKNKATTKAESIAGHVAYPEELLDGKKLEEFYASLELQPNDFFGNMLNLTIFERQNSVKRYTEPFNESEWIRNGDSASVRTSYDLFSNSLRIPAGLLHETIFSSDRPQYMNFGSLGLAIGREITRGFDDKGRLFDGSGNFEAWWAPDTEKKYLDKAECIIKQLENYIVASVGPKSIIGEFSEKEVVDKFGRYHVIEEAYLAYKEWVNRNGPELKLPGLEYTPEQLFWISAANSLCVKNRSGGSQARGSNNMDNFIGSVIRIAFYNRPEFIADFQCPADSPIIPKEKCSM